MILLLFTCFVYYIVYFRILSLDMFKGINICIKILIFLNVLIFFKIDGVF